MLGLHLQADRHSHARRTAARLPADRDGRGGDLTRILVADDDPASVELLTYVLTANGYHVGTALDGNRAVELGTSGDYQLAILDVHMPLYSGMEVLTMLRGRHRLHPVRVIALSGDATDAARDAMEEAGVDDYMVKPVDLKVLLEKVRALVGEA